jgi:hypothetical protein
VQHGTVPLEDADAGLEQRAIAGARQPGEHRHVAAAGDQQPDVDAVMRRRAQRLHIGRDADEVGISQPQRVAGHRRDHLVKPVKPRGAGLAREHAHHHLAGGRSGNRLRFRQIDVFARCRSPGLAEGALDVCHRRTTNLDAGVAPGGDAALRVTQPLVTDAEPGDIADLAVQRYISTMSNCSWL